MKNPNPQIVKAKNYLSINPDATAPQLRDKFKIPYQTAYTIIKNMSVPKTEFLDVVHRISRGRADRAIAEQVVSRSSNTSKEANERVIADIKHLPKSEYEKDFITGLSGNTYQAIDFSPPTQEDLVNHPAHYKTGGIETIDFIEAKELGYHLGNAVKYISRAKHKGNYVQDLEKAIWYIQREINNASPKNDS